MTKVRFEDGFESPPVTFRDGVALIDMMTLRECAEAAGHAGAELVLPTTANVGVPDTLRSMLTTTAERTPDGRFSASATIDTGKLAWDVQPTRHTFTGYDHNEHRGVRFPGQAVWRDGDVTVTQVDAQVDETSSLKLYFAEVPFADLKKRGLYGMWWLATELMHGFTCNQEADAVTVPTQLIAYERDMTEIVARNKSALESCVQRGQAALDESGVRVKVQTMMVRGIAPWFAPPDIVLGANHPVMWWIADGLTPFAVFATTAEAWLAPNQDVTFDFAGD